MKKQYFRNEDSNVCMSLEDCLNEAKSDGLEQVTLIEAIHSNVSEYRWCKSLGAVVEKSECGKAVCSYYEKPKKGNACENKGKFYTYGEEVTFNVITGKQI